MREYKKPKPCVDCGTPTVYRSPKGRCRNCSMNAAIESCRQLRAKEGPFYEKWKKSIRKVGRTLKPA